MRVAVLHIGPQSFHLAVFECSASGAISWRCAFSEPVRSDERRPLTLHPDGDSWRAQGIDASWQARGVDAVERLIGDLLRMAPGCPLEVVASAALGLTGGGVDFCEQVRRRFGLEVELLTGPAQAGLSFLGARAAAPGPGRLAVADLGLRTLELSTGPERLADLTFSVPLGVVTLCDIYLADRDRAERAERERIDAVIRFAAADAARAVWDRRPEHLLLTSGAARALGVVADDLGLRATGSAELSRSILARLAAAPGQGNLVRVAATAFHTLLALLGFEGAAVSPGGLREGVALRAMARSARAGGGRARRASQAVAVAGGVAHLTTTASAVTATATAAAAAEAGGGTMPAW